MIAAIEGISHLTELEEFWASYNQISDLRALDKQLRPLPNLETAPGTAARSSLRFRRSSRLTRREFSFLDRKLTVTRFVRLS
jgi:hypothetical protein